MPKINDISSVSSLIIFGCKNSKDLEYPNAFVGSHSRLLKAQIPMLKSLANQYKTCSLSANQIGSIDNMFVIRQNLQDKQWNYQGNGYYSAYINPKILETYKKPIEDWEYCASFPDLRAKVLRYKKIKVQYDDEGFSEKTKTFEGFMARVFQHEMDHLKGFTILNWRLCHLGIEYMDNNENEENEEIRKTLKEYMDLIAEMKKLHPRKFSSRKLENLNTEDTNEENQKYFDLETVRSENQIFDFEEPFYNKLLPLFGRKLAFSNK